MQECIVEEWSDKDSTADDPQPPSKSKSSKKDKGIAQDNSEGFIFRISNKVSYKTVVKGNFS
jgi:hypothetical protein